MTPSAQYAAAIDVIDMILSGQRADTALKAWGRGHRFAGSKDRAAIRDIVFDVLRQWWSTAALGGGATGRARVIGLLRATDGGPEQVFTGEGYGPAPLSEDELHFCPPKDVPLNLPEFLIDPLRTEYGARLDSIAAALCHRADIFLRVNLLKSTVAQAQTTLLSDGISTEPSPIAPTALRITNGARKVALSTAYQSGLVELQDAASQAVVEFAKPTTGQRVLDYCAGGGGKSLALAALTRAPVTAHDIAPKRMSDIPSRAARAGAVVDMRDRVDLQDGSFDLVFADAPCSGSGSWRRDPEGKLDFAASDLIQLNAAQDDVLENSAVLCAPGGHVAYATCSILPSENSERVDAFLGRNAAWTLLHKVQFYPDDGADGFFCAIMTRA